MNTDQEKLHRDWWAEHPELKERFGYLNHIRPYPYECNPYQSMDLYRFLFSNENLQ